MEQLRVVDFQQHAGDLASQAGVHVLDQREQTLTCRRRRNTGGSVVGTPSVTYQAEEGPLHSQVSHVLYRLCIDCWNTHQASASVPEAGQRPAWRQSVAPVPAHVQQADGERKRTHSNLPLKLMRYHHQGRKQSSPQPQTVTLYLFVWDDACLVNVSTIKGLLNPPYLLHGDLRLGGHVLLGVTHPGGVLVLGHGPHRGGPCC